MGKITESNTSDGLLFYAVFLGEREMDFGNVGLNNQRVYSIHHKDIGVLVSDYPRVSTIKLLRKNLAPYLFVVREVSSRFTTIPARFGQIARDAGQVLQALTKFYPKIRQGLERLDGKIEMGLRVWWNVENLPEYLFEKDVELRARRNRLVAKGGANRMEQIDFGRFFHDRLEKARKEIIGRVLPLLPPAEAKLEKISEETMVANAIVLIRKEHQKQLEEVAQNLQVTMGTDHRVKVDGPWPPFNFVENMELPLNR